MKNISMMLALLISSGMFCSIPASGFAVDQNISSMDDSISAARCRPFRSELPAEIVAYAFIQTEEPILVDTDSNVIFPIDNTLLPSSEIEYNALTGVFTLLRTGIYEITYGVGTSTTGPLPIFAWRLNGAGHLRQSNLTPPSDAIQLTQSFLLEVSEAPATLSLVNFSGATVNIASQLRNDFRGIGAYVIIKRVKR